MQLTPGQKAIDFEWTDITGKTINLSDYRGKKILLSFFRFAQCPFCNLHLNALSKRYDEFHASGLEIIAFIQSPLEAVKQMASRHAAPFPILADYEEKIYSKYGITHSRAGMFKAMFLRAGTLIHAMLKGYIPLKTEGDPALMPAEFLINPDGTIHTAHYGTDSGHHLSMETIDAFLPD